MDTAQTIGGFILAAGEGRRLRPATFTRPKALIPFCGVPLLRLVASQLTELGLRGTVVNVSYQGERVFEAAQRIGRETGWDLRISQEDVLLDTGGGLRTGLRLLPECEHIVVHNVDTVLDYDLRELVDTHLRTGALATLLMVPGRGPRTVDLLPDGRVQTFRRPWYEGEYTFSGVHIFHRDILDYLPDEPAVSIILAYERALADGKLVLGLPIGETDYWADLGTADQYIRAHGEIADCALRYHPAMQHAQAEQARRRAEWEQRGVHCTGAIGLGEELGVPTGTHLHNAVLWDYTRLPRPLLYADGIFVGDDVHPPVPISEHRRPDPRIYASLDLDPEHCRIEPLQKQGSGRTYCRLTDGSRSWVWCAYDPERRENAGFAAIADFLSRLDICVPRVQMHLADAFELVSRDLGQNDLQKTAMARKEGYLHRVVEQISRLHVLGDQAVRLEELPLQRGFTKGLYDWERDYFRRHILGNLLNRPELWGIAAREYCGLRDCLLRQALVPIHRDLQSANIMIVDDEVYLIDFQGMRLGCAAYDLGALLYDPYQCFPRTLRDEVWSHYCECVTALGGQAQPIRILQAAAVQRLLQALGAYGKLWLQDGLDWYRPFIRTGLQMLLAATEESGEFLCLHELARLTSESVDEILK